MIRYHFIDSLRGFALLGILGLQERVGTIGGTVTGVRTGRAGG